MPARDPDSGTDPDQSRDRVRAQDPPAYHRLLRAAEGYRWWRPLVAVLLAILLWAIIVGGIAAALLLAEARYSMEHWGEPLEINDVHRVLFVIGTDEPLAVLRALGCWAVMLPCAWIGLRCAGIRPFARVWSVELRLRLRLLVRFALWALVAVVVANVIGGIIDLVVEALQPPPWEDPDYRATGAMPGYEPGERLLSLALILTLLPLFAAGHEVLLRGLVVQTVGSWLRSPWPGILLSTVLSPLALVALFGPPHLGSEAMVSTQMWGLVSAALTGGTAAWLAWRTGGLEAAICLQWAGFVLLWASRTHGNAMNPALGENGLGAFYVIGQIVGYAFYGWIVIRTHRRDRELRQTQDAESAESAILRERYGRNPI